MSVRHWRPVISVAIVAVTLTVVSMAWATLLTPTKVIGGKGNQILPVATPGATFVAFSSSRPGHPDIYDAYLKPAGQRKIKVNQNGQAFTGGISGQTLIYQHFRSGQSNIQEFDMVTHQHSAPGGVNTPAWEWAPYISGDWVMFGRINLRARPDAYRVILRNELTSETRVLQAHTGAPQKSLTPGGLDGDWLSWDRFTPRTHNSAIVRYQISTQQQLLVP